MSSQNRMKALYIISALAKLGILKAGDIIILYNLVANLLVN